MWRTIAAVAMGLGCTAATLLLVAEDDAMADRKESSERPPARTEIATLGGGCFWCLEAVFEEMAGVRRVVSGYAGGKVKNPTYEQVCSGATGHAEVVQVEFDPSVADFGELLRVFFAVHDPTTRDRQGADVGSQYRSVIFYHDERQRKVALEKIAEVNASGIWKGPVVTEVLPFEAFYEAEAYHQDYFEKNPNAGYCRAVVAPKVSKFRILFPEKTKR